MIDDGPRLTGVGLTAESENLEVQYVCSYETPRSTLLSIGSVCQILVANGAQGAFSNPTRSQSDSGLALAGEPYFSNDRIVHRLAAANLDIRAFQCLRNMVRRLRRTEIVVDHVLVLDLDRPDVRSVEFDWPTEENEARVYPDMPSALKSRFQYEGSEFGKSRRCLVEVRGVVEPHTVTEFERAVRPWYVLVEAGGYSTPVGLPEETESIAGSVSQFDANSIEIGLNSFFASECAWAALANIAERFWRVSGGPERILVD